MESHLTQIISFINTTASPIFLTGKAGTGKTTFLKNLKDYTQKNFIVVAPTGIAALNAGGVTIHSQFLLPPLTFIPDRSLPDSFHENPRVLNQSMLARQHPLNSVRKQVLRSIDLLVIDEVSMLRADLLDAMDYRMKAARNNFRQAFGGVQVLFIGDLYQLPPVIGREEEDILKKYYSSGWFYEAHALKPHPPVYIELTRIFRQHDPVFIALLNNLRNNTVTPQDIEMLNQQYQPVEEGDPLKEIITLTTHNYKADQLNQHELKKLTTPSHFFDARLEGDFPESMFPVQSRIELKEGAQIMFTRNDTDEAKAYVNGQLATVVKIAMGEIEVVMTDSQHPYTLTRERWENKKYILNALSQTPEEEVVGSFEQYPVKLAWAITVHKSQGLTFDKAILDVGQAFAPGQVYVALSRLRTLSGLILRTRIPSSAISTDAHVAAYAKEYHRPEQLPALMKEKQRQFIHQLIERTFDFTTLVKEISYVKKDEKEMLEDTMKPVLDQLIDRLQGEYSNTEKFRGQLSELLRTDTSKVAERLEKGRVYYRNFLWDTIRILAEHLEQMKQRKRVKTYVNQLSELDQWLMKKWEEVDVIYAMVTGIFEDKVMDMSALAVQRKEERMHLLASIRNTLPPVVLEKSKKRKGKKKKEGDDRSTYDITLDLFKNGMSVPQIAEERHLAITTIEGHLAKAVEMAKLDMDAFIKPEELDVIKTALTSLAEDASLKELYSALNGKYGYGKLRAVMAHVRKRE
jgi:hypothetical protein